MLVNRLVESLPIISIVYSYSQNPSPLDASRFSHGMRSNSHFFNFSNDVQIHLTCVGG